VIVEIGDTGAGIPPEALPHLFEPFFSTKRVGVGTGLGLSICHGIITDLGGVISVQNQAARGRPFASHCLRRAPETVTVRCLRAAPRTGVAAGS